MKAYCVFRNIIIIYNSYIYTVEPLYNGQVGAGAFVCYLEVSFIGRFHHNNVYLTLTWLKIVDLNFPQR